MKKQRASPGVTKKHKARAERERIQRNWILAGTIATALLVVGILGYGYVDTKIIKPRKPVAIVDGQEISMRDFQTRVRLALSPGTEPVSVGLRILNELIDDIIIQREANRLGIMVSEADIDRAIQQAFGFFPEGTPTSAPTRTPDPTKLVEASATPTTGPSPTVGPTSTPQPTATTYTREAFDTNFNDFIQVLADQYNATEEDYREYFEAQLYRERLGETFEGDVERDQEQVWLKHIRVEELEIAEEILTRLDDSEAWDDLAEELSEDMLTKDSGGDLGWLTFESAFERFGQDAVSTFQAPISDIIGPIETQEGWHLLLVVDRGVQPLDDYAYYQAVQRGFDTWLGAQREISDIVIMENWTESLPEVPTLNY